MDENKRIVIVFIFATQKGHRDDKSFAFFGFDRLVEVCCRTWWPPQHSLCSAPHLHLARIFFSRFGRFVSSFSYLEEEENTGFTVLLLVLWPGWRWDLFTHEALCGASCDPSLAYEGWGTRAFSSLLLFFRRFETFSLLQF